MREMVTSVAQASINFHIFKIRCRWDATTRKDLFAHLESESHNAIIECSGCRQKYISKKELQEHKKTSNCGLPRKKVRKRKIPATEESKKDEKFICNQCQFESADFKKLFDHLQSEHKESLSCVLCDLRFKNKYQLLAHLKRHGKDRYCAQHFIAFDCKQKYLAHFRVPGHNLECGICQKKFKNKHNVAAHRAKVHLRKFLRDKEYKCPQCPIVYSYSTTLARHIKTAHEKSRVFLCEDCGKPYNTPEELKKHMFKKHNKGDYKPKGPYQCEFCGKKFPVITYYKIHRAEHLGHQLCWYCKESFETSEKLKEHVETLDHHWFQCDKCTSRFKSKAYLTAHLLKHEEGFKKARDEYKNRKPKGCQGVKGGIRKHEKLDNGKFRYICPTCSREFATASSYYRHLHVHQEKKFVCEICNKAFSQLQGLRAHRSVHSDKRPYRCPICEKSFKDSSTMYKHKRIHGESSTMFPKPPPVPAPTTSSAEYSKHFINPTIYNLKNEAMM